MNQRLKEKIMESFSSVLPITAIVFVLSIVVVPLDVGTILLFLVGAAFLIIGMGFFSLGADTALMPLGEGMGIALSKSNKVVIVLIVAFIMGTVITIAEPDLVVLANQVPSIPNNILIMCVAVGVGIFLLVAVLRIIFKIPLNKMLMVLYVLLFGLSYFVPESFLAVAFDSGGVTTGPITVPFIMAFGLGISTLRGDKDAHNDSFGLVALSSIGPIMAVMLLGIFFNPGETAYVAYEIYEVTTMQDVFFLFMYNLPHYAKEVLVAIAPIAAAMVVFQLITHRFKGRALIRIGVGIVYTFIGLVMFLTGVNVGFMPVGNLLGSQLAGSELKWLLIPVGMVVGYFVVAAEPAVHVLNRQVEEVTSGAISQKTMQVSLSLGVAVSVGLAMIRVLTGISIYWIIIPGYAIALILSIFVPKIFVGIAFDSGGVASGPMTATFLLPLAVGACEALGGNVMSDAFGMVAMVAMTPLIAIQIMGLVYKFKLDKLESDADTELATEFDDISDDEFEDIIELEEGAKDD